MYAKKGDSITATVPIPRDLGHFVIIGDTEGYATRAGYIRLTKNEPNGRDPVQLSTKGKLEVSLFISREQIGKLVFPS